MLSGVFMKLPLLTEAAERFVTIEQGPIYLVGIQHLVESTVDLVDLLVRKLHLAGVWLGGKPYSVSMEAVERLESMGICVVCGPAAWESGRLEAVLTRTAATVWQEAEASLAMAESGTVVILDDGSKLLSRLPIAVARRHRCVGVEQTTHGLNNWSRLCPIVEVASSAAKRIVEPVLIADRVVTALRENIDLRRPRCGIIGIGAVGGALRVALQEYASEILLYDIDPHIQLAPGAGGRCVSYEQLVSESDVIIGCSGSNAILPGSVGGTGDLWLASASSSDVEFEAVLRMCPTRDVSVGSVVSTRIGARSVHVLNGGAPVNFVRGRISVASELIQLTRAMLYAGIVQALALKREDAEGYMLDPDTQDALVCMWRELCFASSPLVGNACSRWKSDRQWIMRMSRGLYVAAQPARP